MNITLKFVERRDCYFTIHFKSCSSQYKRGSILKIKSVRGNQLISVGSTILFNESENKIEINGLLGWHNNFKHNEEVILEFISYTFHKCDIVNIKPFSNDDWHLINKYSREIENKVLKQINLVCPNLIFPIWVDKLCILLKIYSVDQFSGYCLLSSSTKLVISPLTSEEYHKLQVEKPDLSHNGAVKIKSFNSSLNFIYIFFDFIHFLIHGKSIFDRKEEKLILNKWSNDFSYDLQDKSINGRCFKNSNFKVNHIQVHSNRNIDWFNKSTLYFGKFTKENNSNEIEFKGILEIVQNKSNKTNPFNQFHIPIDYWLNWNFNVGDRLKFQLNNFVNKDSIYKIILKIPCTIKETDAKKVESLFLSKLGTTDQPLLLKNNMLLFLQSDNHTLISSKIFIEYKTKNKEKKIPNEDIEFLLCDKLVKLWNIKILVIQDPSIDPDIYNLKFDQSLYLDDLNDEVSVSIKSGLNLQDVSYLLLGSSGFGKTYLTKRFLKYIEGDLKYQYYTCYVECRELAGLHLETLKTKLNNNLIDCLNHSPSILVLDNLDKLTPSIQDADDNQLENRFIDISYCMKYILENMKNMIKLNQFIIISTAENEFTLNNVITDSVIFDKIIRLNHSVFSSIVLDKIKDSSHYNDISNLLSEFLKDKSRLFNNLSGYDANRFINEIHISLSKRDGILNREDLEDAFKDCLMNSSKINQPAYRCTFDDVFGLDIVKKKLKETFIWPFRYPNIYSKLSIKLQRGFLLYGLPGSGKSYLGMALANELGINYRFIRGPELLNKFIGSSEASIRNLFSELRQNQPSLVFFDEFDALAPKRGHDSTGVTDRVVNQLLTELDGITTGSGGDKSCVVFVLVASNRPDLIDPALLRSGRIHGRGFCQCPNTTIDRIEAIKFFLSRYITESHNEFNKILEYLRIKSLDKSWLNLYSYADLKSIVDEAFKLAVLRYNENTAQDNGSNFSEEIQVTVNDFKKSVECSRASLTQIQIEQYNLGFTELFSTNIRNSINFKSKATLA